MRTLKDVRRGRIRKHNPVNSNDVVLEDAVSVEDLKKAVVEWLPHLGVKFDLLSARDWIVEFFELEGDEK